MGQILAGFAYGVKEFEIHPAKNKQGFKERVTLSGFLFQPDHPMWKVKGEVEDTQPEDWKVSREVAGISRKTQSSLSSGSDCGWKKYRKYLEM